MNPYEILEISPGSSAEDIRSAYHRLAKKWHPDRFTGAEKEAAEKQFRQLAEAFNMLKDAGKREDLSRNLAAPPAPTYETVQLQQEPIPQTIPINERTAADWYEEAKQAFESREYEKALGLIQYCIRMDAEKAEHHILFAKVLDAGGGDKKALVRALETAIRINPKDADSTIRLAEVFQAVGMHARATKLWETARYLAPNHKYFIAEQKKATTKARTAEQIQGLGEQFAVLKEKGKALLNRWLKRG